MDKFEKYQEVFTLSNMAFRKLMDLKDDLRKDLKDLLIINGVKYSEDIQNIEDYKKAVEIEWQMEKLGSQAEDLSAWIDNLIKIRL